MIKPSAYNNYSITIGLFEPLVKGGFYIRTLENEISSYNHTISAVGGFVSASIVINSDDIDEWFGFGIGRHIVAYGSAGEIIWEGFIDNVAINLGNITIERGRLTELCNRCSLTYTPVTTDEETGDLVSGTTTLTEVADDEDSIDKYGIWEQVVSGGSIVGVGSNVAEQILDYIQTAEGLRDLYISEHREPEVSHSPIIGIQGGEVTITLDCKGYVDWLTYVYNFAPANTSEYSIMVYNKIIAVLNENPNDIFSSDLSHVKYNPLLINSIEDKDRTAKTIIDEAVSIGDIDNNRWVFGVYENRTPYYYPVSTEIDYMYYVNSSIQKITDKNNTEILPWDVRPGKIVFLPDTILGNVQKSDIRTDPRVMFLEEIEYTAPDTINLKGKKVMKFDQLLNQLGLA